MNARVAQGLMLLGWLLILGLTICAAVADPSGLITLFDAPWPRLVTADLTVELILIAVFIYWDVQRRGKAAGLAWAWIVGILLLGGVATLGYLLLRSLDRSAPPLLPRA